MLRKLIANLKIIRIHLFIAKTNDHMIIQINIWHLNLK